mgnify:CR=1 FL=1
MYTCPMHPEIVSDKPGKCPKCGMNLVPKDASLNMHINEDKGLSVITWKSYIPLVVIFVVLVLTTIAISINDFKVAAFSM